MSFFNYLKEENSLLRVKGEWATYVRLGSGKKIDRVFDIDNGNHIRHLLCMRGQERSIDRIVA